MKFNLTINNQDAYILHALISVKTGSYASALNSLNQAISNNFMIRENPLFMLIKADVEYRMEDFKTMLATTEIAFDIPGVREPIKVVQQKKGAPVPQQRKAQSQILTFSEKERASMFVLHAKALAKNKRDKDARGVMLKAI